MSECGDTQNGRLTRVLLVNIASMHGELFKFALRGERDLCLVGTASSVAELEDLFRTSAPDVALVGTRGPQDQAAVLCFLEQTTNLSPKTRQIVISPEMDREDTVSYFRAGARGLLCGSKTDLAMLVKCIRCVDRGQIWANSEQLNLLLESLAHPRHFKVTNVLGDALLSQREEQVLDLLASGLSNRELAAALKLSEHTIKNHLFRIFDKLGVSNRLEAVLYALTHREQRATLATPDPSTFPPVTLFRGGLSG